MRCFVDTNLLIYSLDPSDPAKRAVAAGLIGQFVRTGALVLSSQSLNECYRVLTFRRALMPAAEARRFVSALGAHCLAPSGLAVTQMAWQIEDRHGFSWWDCLLLAAAQQANCTVFLTEDMTHDRFVGDMRLFNPFLADFDATFPS